MWSGSQKYFYAVNVVLRCTFSWFCLWSSEYLGFLCVGLCSTLSQMCVGAMITLTCMGVPGGPLPVAVCPHEPWPGSLDGVPWPGSVWVPGVLLPVSRPGCVVPRVPLPGYVSPRSTFTWLCVPRIIFSWLCSSQGYLYLAVWVPWVQWLVWVVLRSTKTSLSGS